MDEIIQQSLYFGVGISLLSYQLGLFLKNKYKKAIFNPILISVALIILILVTFKIEYKTYYEGAKYLSYLLTPATVCLAVPLYEQYELLRKNVRAVLVGILSGVLASMVSILAFSFLFGLSHSEYVTLLPKSITTAIGMGVSEELGGIVTITVVSIMITGIFGNIIAESLYHYLKIEEPIAKGLALGTASHALGTAKAIEIGEVEGAMSGLAIGVAGLMTVITATLFSYIY